MHRRGICLEQGRGICTPRAAPAPVPWVRKEGVWDWLVGQATAPGPLGSSATRTSPHFLVPGHVRRCGAARSLRPGTAFPCLLGTRGHGLRSGGPTMASPCWVRAGVEATGYFRGAP